jgi:RNA polymerase sigma factor for flagellar operon FliA
MPTSPLDDQEPEALLVIHLPWIDRVATMVCRKHGLVGDDADDFISLARMKMIEGDYAVLRSFRGECKLTTYLATVVTQRFFEWEREKHGRWRPSAAAQRAGPVAVILEQLLFRDGWTLSQAGEYLRSRGLTEMTDGQLAQLLATLKPRGPLRPLEDGDAGLDLVPSQDQADDAINALEAERERALLQRKLERALSMLDPEDSLILRLHLMDGRQLADIARGLGLVQRELYSRVAQLKKRVRKMIEDMDDDADDGLAGQPALVR